MRQHSLLILFAIILVLMRLYSCHPTVQQHSNEIYSKDNLDWATHKRQFTLQWNDSYVDSNLVRKGFLDPSKPIVFIQHYLVAFVWRNISEEFNISSVVDLMKYMKNSTGRNLKIGIDRQYGLLFRDFLDYHRIYISENLETTTHASDSYSITPFLFFKRNCRPRHVLEDFDVIVSSSGAFFDSIRYYRESTGKRKVKSEMSNMGMWNISTLINPDDFLPIKLAPALIGYEYEAYPYFILPNSSAFSSRNSYYISDIITLNQFYNFGQVTFEDLDFLNSLLSYRPDTTQNFTIDTTSFTRMIQNTQFFLNMTFPSNFSLDQVYSNYFSSALHYCTDSTCNDYVATDQDFWNIPVLLLVSLYFIVLFGSTFFLKPAFKRRMLIPYLPLSIYFFELTHSKYFNRSCLQAISFVRMFLLTWIISVYMLTIIRFYLLRNLYSILSNPILVNKKIGQISFVKRLVSPIISILVIISVSGILSVVCSIHGVVMFLDIYFFEFEVFNVVNISFVVYILVGCSIGILTVVLDFCLNWKVIKTKGLVSFLKFDDPFNVRIDLMSMILLLVVAIIHTVVNETYERIFFFLESLLFISMSGGFTLLFETWRFVIKKKHTETISELESFLKDDNFKKIYKDFSTREFSLENILFYEKLIQIKSQFGNSQIDKQFIQEIQDEFIAINSQYELNISSSTRNSFSELKKRDSSADELFEMFHADIITNMNDTLARLIGTEEFEKWFEIYELQVKNNALADNNL